MGLFFIDENEVGTRMLLNLTVTRIVLVSRIGIATTFVFVTRIGNIVMTVYRISLHL